METFNAGIRSCDEDSPEETSNQSKSSNESHKNANDFVQCDIRGSSNDSRTSVDLESLNKNFVSEDADSSDTTISVIDSTTSFDSEGLNKNFVSEDDDSSGTRASINDSKTSVDSEGLNKNSNSEDNDSNDTRVFTNDSRTSVDSEGLKNSITEDADRNCAAIPSNNNNIIFSLSHSPDFSLMQKIAAVIPKNTATPLETIELVIFRSGLENEIKYVLMRENASVICCQLYVGSTLLATGREATEEKAKETAMQYCVEILANLSNLPNKTLEDVKQELENWKKVSWNSSLLWSEISSLDLELKLKILKSQLSKMEKNPRYADLHLILSIAEKLFDEKYAINKNIPAMKKIKEATTELKCDSQVHFFHFGEDPDYPLHLRAYHCDFVIKNIFICKSKACSKKKAKIDASEQGVHILTNFVENWEFEKQQNVQEQLQSLEINPKSLKIDHSFPELRINHRLLADSKNRQLVIFDCSKTSCQYVASTIIYVTAIRCKKDLNYEIDEIPKRKWTHQRHIKDEKTKKGASKNSLKMFRCSVTLDKEEIGKADGFTEKEARSNASENALQFLQKNVYTIKVKKEIEDRIIIGRSHVLNAENPSSLLDESDVGCKLLKTDVCPTCGGTGKISAITESNVANDHRFGQGVSFNNKAQKRRLVEKIKALLKDYSQSNTTSDLIFSTEFSKNERMEIYRLAGRYKLSRIFLGKGKLMQRQLSIRRKISPMQLLDYLIETGGSTNKYELEDRSV